MSSVNNVVVTLLYEDETTRNYTFEDVEVGSLSSVKTKILAINANENNEYENFYKTFVSDDGEPVTRIEACRIIEIEEEVVYGG